MAVDVPAVFFSVSQWYQRFEQLSDDDLVAWLEREEAPGDRGELTEAWPDPEEERLAIPFEDSLGPGELEADLVLPPHAKGLVALVQAGGSGRGTPRTHFVARALQDAGLGTLAFDLLTPDEAAEDAVTAQLRLDARLLAGRVLEAERWISQHPRARALRVCCLGASTGAAAALVAAARRPERFAAIVSRGGLTDLVEPGILRKVRAPVLLVAGGRDEAVLRSNRAALAHLPSAELAVVPGATHLFEEPGALGEVAALAARWFERHLAGPAAAGAAPPV